MIVGFFADISDLDDVLDSAKKIVDWRGLGIKLGLHYNTLETIDEEQRGRVQRCKREMLAEWLRGKDDAKEQTWSTLEDAIKVVLYYTNKYNLDSYANIT